MVLKMSMSFWSLLQKRSNFPKIYVSLKEKDWTLAIS